MQSTNVSPSGTEQVEKRAEILEDFKENIQQKKEFSKRLLKLMIHIDWLLRLLQMVEHSWESYQNCFPECMNLGKGPGPW